MKIKSYSYIIVVSCALGALLTTGCATKKETSMLTSARENFTRVQGSADVNKYAPLELQEAKTAYDKAAKKFQAGGKVTEVDHLAYMANQKALIADEVAAMKVADMEVETASAERNRVLLEARTREAKQAQSEADKARKELEAERIAAEEQRRAAEEMRRDSEEQRRAAEEQQRLAAEKEQRRLAEEKRLAAAEQQRLALEQAQADAEKARQEAAAAEERLKKLEGEIAELQANQTERGLVLTLGDVLFDTGKSDLKPGASATIAKVGKFLQEYPTRKIQIEGFTDSVGSDDYNLGLSSRRAESARNALNAQGVALDRIIIRGYGKAFPVVSNDTPEGRQRNRRVEIIISDENGIIPERTR